MAGQVAARLAALLTAAAPPPMTAIDPAAGETVVGGTQVGTDLVGGLQIRLPPEAVADAGRDDQRVVGFGDLGAVGAAAEHRAGRQVHPGERRLNGADPVQSAELLERDPVVPRPVLRPRQPHTQLLAADQCGFGGDPHDVGVAGQPDRGQDAAVAESGDDDPLAAHA